MSILEGKLSRQPKLKDSVLVKTTSGSRVKGVIQWIGALKGDSKNITKYGIELASSMGDHNGTYKGHRYFRCAKNHAIFADRSQIIRVLTATKSSQRKIEDVMALQKPMKIENETFDRIEKIIFDLIRVHLHTNSTLIDSNIVSLIYIYCDPYNFSFLKQCTEHTVGEISIHGQGLALSNLNDNGGFGIILLGDNAVFPFPEWSLPDIADGNVMEYQCSFIIHRLNTQNGNIYVSNGYFGIVVVSENFYHFASLKDMKQAKKKKTESKMESKVHCIIHDNNFKRHCLVRPRKYYGDCEPVICPFDFPYKTAVTFRIQCKKQMTSTRHGLKEKMEWNSRIVVEAGTASADDGKDGHGKFQFVHPLGDTRQIGRFRIGLLLYAPDAECSNTWLYRCKASIESQQVRQLCNTKF